MDSRMIDLIKSLSCLIEDYGIDAVTCSLEFIRGFPCKIETIRIGYWRTDVYVTITRDQFNELRVDYNLGNKIMTIKKLREMTQIGLKDAKDIVENTNWN